MKLIYFGADAPWTSLLMEGFKRRNTHLLRSFANSGLYSQVVAIHFATRQKVIEAIFSKRNRNTAVQDVFVANILINKLKGGFFEWVNHLFFHLQIQAQGIRKFNRNENIIFCYWPKGYELNKKLSLKGRVFFDTDHNIIHDENLNQQQQKAQLTTLLDAGKNSELVLSSTRSMLDWYRENGFTNLYHLRNGITPERFTNLPNIKKQFSNPVIGYIGTVSKWIDYEAYQELIENNPQWNFPIYGPSYKTETYKKLQSFKNVHFMGPVKADDVPLVLKSFDVALNLYRNESWLDVDSMKLYEYLAVGVPVVSLNYHPNLEEDFEHLLYLANDAEEMQAQIRRILDGKHCNPAVDDFIAKSTWDKRIEQFHYDIFRK